MNSAFKRKDCEFICEFNSSVGRIKIYSINYSNDIDLYFRFLDFEHIFDQNYRCATTHYIYIDKPLLFKNDKWQICSYLDEGLYWSGMESEFERNEIISKFIGYCY